MITRAEQRLICANLGADPLRRRADVDRARDRMARSTKPVGAVLLDQTVIAGLGNIYRAEVLFLCGIDPRRPARQLSDDDFDVRVGAVRAPAADRAPPRPHHHDRPGRGRSPTQSDDRRRHVVRVPPRSLPSMRDRDPHRELGRSSDAVVPDLPTWLTMRRDELPTPALCVDLDALDHNIDTMAAARPGRRAPSPRQGVQVDGVGAPRAVTAAATARSAAPRCARWRAWSTPGWAMTCSSPTRRSTRRASARSRRVHPDRITVAVDSPETVAVAVEAVDERARRGADRRQRRHAAVRVHPGGRRRARRIGTGSRPRGPRRDGLRGPRGRQPGPRLAPRAAGAVHGRAARRARRSWAATSPRPAAPGTYDLHDWAAEVQAGSYLLMDTAYARLGLPFRQALTVEATVLSVNDEHYAVADAGLKAFGMDHGDPDMVDHDVLLLLRRARDVHLGRRRPPRGGRPRHDDPRARRPHRGLPRADVGGAWRRGRRRVARRPAQLVSDGQTLGTGSTISGHPAQVTQLSSPKSARHLAGAGRGSHDVRRGADAGRGLVGADDAIARRRRRRPR